MNTLSAIRRWILALLAFGLVGTGVELTLTEHYETGLQVIPLVVIALGICVVAWHTLAGSALSIRVLRGTMGVFLLAGIVGMGLHYRGGAEFQVEIDPAQSRWEIFKKVMRAKAPPVLASGTMVQLGLLGLLYVYKHPALEQDV
ncbi:MAG TPA: hypothetical protein VM818_22175 [Vicinamibacterales bacterium]|jgi:hypothetical protein|nr:hypothetical protein [Vicinamibacterales bacterium]